MHIHTHNQAATPGDAERRRLYLRQSDDLKSVSEAVNAVGGKGSRRRQFESDAQRSAQLVLQLADVSLVNALSHFSSRQGRREHVIREHFLTKAKEEIKAKTNRAMSLIGKAIFWGRAAELAVFEKRIALRMCEDTMRWLEARQSKVEQLLFASDVADGLRQTSGKVPKPPKEQDQTLQALTRVAGKLRDESTKNPPRLEKYETALQTEIALKQILAHFQIVKPPRSMMQLVKENQQGYGTLLDLIKASDFRDPDTGAVTPGAKERALDIAKSLRKWGLRDYQDVKLMSTDINSLPIKDRFKALMESRDYHDRTIAVEMPRLQADLKVLRPYEEDPTILILTNPKSPAGPKIVLDTESGKIVLPTGEVTQLTDRTCSIN